MDTDYSTFYSHGLVSYKLDKSPEKNFGLVLSQPLFALNLLFLPTESDDFDQSGWNGYYVLIAMADQSIKKLSTINF